MEGEIQYRLLNEEDGKTAREFLERYYTPKNAICKHLGMTNEDIDCYFSRIPSFLRQGNSFGAFVDGKMVALMANVAEEKDDMKESSIIVKEKVAKVVRLYESLTGKNLTKLLGTDNYWEMKLGCVSPEYKHSKIVDELGRRTVQRAIEKGCKKLIGLQTYDHMRIGKARLMAQKDVTKFVDPVTGKKEFEGMKPPHTLATFTVFDVPVDTKMKNKL